MRGLQVIGCLVMAAFVAPVFTGCYGDDAAQRMLANLEKKPGGGKDSKYWIGKINDPSESMDAFKYLIELKDKSVVPELVVVFQKDRAHRGDVAMVLGEIGDKSVVPTLLGGISTEYSDKIDQRQVNDRTNEKIALALAKLGDPSAKPALIKLLDSKAANVLNAAIKAESVFKDPDAVPGLMVIVKNDKLAKNIRSDAIKVLGDIGDPRAVPALVLAMYIEKQGTVYPEASYALMQIGAPAVPELTKALERKNPEVEAIGKKFIVGAIEAKASDTLGWICDKSAYDPLARVLVKVREDNPIATAKTAYALARLQDRRAVGIISKYIENEEDPSVRQHYTLALNMLGDHSVMPILFKASKKPDVEKYRKEGANDLELNMLRESRNDIIRTIARLCNDKDLPEWLKMEKAEKDDKVKKTWEEYRPMVEAAKECGDKFDCWNGKLGDPNKLVREKAAYSIGRIGSDQAAEVLVKLIDDKEQGVQYAALQGIYNMAEKNGARLYDLVVIKEGQMDKAKREKMADDLKLLKLRLAKAGGKK